MFSHFISDAGVEAYWLLIAAAGIGAISYFLGCFNGSAMISRYILRDDIRNHGSGNAGLTNFYRTFGGPLTFAVIASDAVKAIIAILFASYIGGLMSPELIVPAKYWAGTFCLLGHIFPFNFQFKGGKGILSGGTIIIMMDWRIALVAWAVFMVLAISTKYVSLGSCCAAATFPITTFFVFRDGFCTVLAIFLAGLVIWKHRGNIQRLMNGTESKFSFHRKQEAPADTGEKWATDKPVKEMIAEEDGKAASDTEPQDSSAPAEADAAAAEDSSPVLENASDTDVPAEEPAPESPAQEETSSGAKRQPEGKKSNGMETKVITINTQKGGSKKSGNSSSGKSSNKSGSNNKGSSGGGKKSGGKSKQNHSNKKGGGKA